MNFYKRMMVDVLYWNELSRYDAPDMCCSCSNSQEPLIIIINIRNPYIIRHVKVWSLHCVLYYKSTILNDFMDKDRYGGNIYDPDEVQF